MSKSEHKGSADGHGYRHGACLHHGDAHERDHAAWSRRDFLTRVGLATAGTVLTIGNHTIRAFGQSPLLRALQQSATDRILVLVQLNGGNDGLNTVIPVENDIYYNNRPTIAIPKNSAVLLDNDTGLHPGMSALEPLWLDGKMSLIHNVGYPRQSRSHFEGTVNWSTARDQGAPESTGWLARYLTEEHPDFFTNPLDYPLAVRVGGPATLFQSAAGNLAVTFSDASDLERFVQQGGFYDTENVPATLYGAELAYIRSVTNASFRYVESVQTASDAGANLSAYPPGGLATSLAVVARMLRGGLPTNLYTVSRGGFDTHSGQGGAQGSHANLLSDVATSVAAFMSDLAQDGLDQRVVVMTFSEFGRTLRENGSGGTDHGAGAPMLLFGAGLSGGIYGSQSNLVDLYGGDPMFTTDYRSVYATLLQDWLGLEAAAVDSVLGGSFTPMGFVEDVASVANDPSPELPAGLSLHQNYPNPFNPTTTIRFDLPTSSDVHLAVFDMNGRRVRSLVERRLPAGSHSINFDADRLPSGAYVYRLQTDGKTVTRTMILAKYSVSILTTIPPT